MRNYIKNNEGLTLVEILAALVLLSIVLITFMSFFTQSAKFTAHNQETLTAVQVAEDVVSIVRENEEEIKEGTVSAPAPAINYVCTEMEDKINEAKKSEEFELEILEVDLVSAKGGCEGFTVDVTLSKKLLDLGKADISVRSGAGKGINNPEFETEMYFEVNP